VSNQFKAPEGFRDDLRDALLEHAASLARHDPLTAPGPLAASPPAGPRIVRRIVPAFVLAAVLVAAILALRSGGAVAPQPATAASVLKASADALDRVGGPRALGPHDYFYTRTAEWWLYVGYGPHPYAVGSIQEEWLARNGRGRSRYEVAGLSGVDVNRSLPFTRSSDARLLRHARPFIISTLPSPGILLSYAQLRRLPTDPARLGDALNRLAASYHVNRLFPQPAYHAAIRWAMLRALAEAPTSAALRAALYRVLAATPGIRLLGRTRDSIGRHGVAVAVEVQDVRLEMIIDPTTGELLQTSRTLLHRSRLYPGQVPGLNYRVTFLASGVVTSTRARIP
jgi:hypothetical protein